MTPGTAALLGTGISSAVDLMGGILGRRGQKEANRQNLQIAREQMNFQRYMSNTAYRRAATDLEAAGLNRILALGKPATTPAGALATMQNPNAPLQTGISNAAAKMHSALELKRKAAEIKVLTERARLTGNQADAIAPAAEGGEQVGSWIAALKDADYGAMGDRFAQDSAGVASAAAGGFRKMGRSATQSLINAGQDARDRIYDVARSMGLRGDVLERNLINAVDRMDLNTKGWSNERKLAWAMENLNEIARFIDREKKRR